MKTKARILNLIALFCVLLTSSAYGADDVFVVQDIKVEATAKSAVAAREIAFNKALDHSFKLLTMRLTDKEQQDSIALPSSDEIAGMVLDFEITSEKSSHTSYRATYTIRYNKKGIREFFGQQQVTYTDLSGQSLLVLPFLQIGNQTTLWNAQNPFLKGWQDSLTQKNALTKIVVPISDLQDMIDIKDNEALTYKKENIARMISRYHAKEAVILIAAPSNGLNNLQNSPLNIYIYKTHNTHPEYLQTLEVSPSSRGDIVEKSIKQTKRFLQEEWKRQHATTPSDGLKSYNVVVRFPSIDQWVKTKNVLEQNIGKEAITLKSLRTKEATLQIDFAGHINSLDLSLRRAGYALRPVGAGYFEVFAAQ
jgi:hypothetical protein